jgi:hypothetical protein
MEQEKNSADEVRIKDWLPFIGIYLYTRRNIQQETTNTNNYANGFYHLLVANIAATIGVSYLFFNGLEKLLN